MVQIRKSQNFAKLGKIREFFPYLHDSLISKVLVIIFQNVFYLVLKLTFQTKIVKQLAFVGKKCWFWPESYKLRPEEARKVTEI